MLTNSKSAMLAAATILGVSPLWASPHSLSTRVPQGPAGAHAKQMSVDRLRAVRPTLPSAFLSSADGNFQAQPLDKTHVHYVPSFAAPPTMPQLEHPSAGQSTMTGTAHKQFGLRQMSLDPSVWATPTITAGSAAAPIRSAPDRSTRLAPGRDQQQPLPSYGPQWLMVEVENLPASPRSAEQSGLQK